MTEPPIGPDPEIEILRTHPGDPSSELN